MSLGIEWLQLSCCHAVVNLGALVDLQNSGHRIPGTYVLHTWYASGSTVVQVYASGSSKGVQGTLLVGITQVSAVPFSGRPWK